MRRFKLLQPGDPEDETVERVETEQGSPPPRSWKEWLRFLFWTLVWGGGTLWLTLEIIKVFKEKAHYF
ncbi:MAG: hypothetical protein HY282_00265 [Nitrospirae bacterium]|nr:hypothetical protein [Candidatus Manganitrophaceae bacterium]